MLGTLRQNLRYAVRALWEEPAEEIPAKPAGNLRRNPRHSWRGGCQSPCLICAGINLPVLLFLGGMTVLAGP